MIKTSIIIPVYNTAPYIEECLDSVFCQTQKEIEVIAIDDGSTDDSWNVLMKMKEKYPGLILVRQTHQCQGAARNKGVEMAKGEYIYFLDSDDYILRETLTGMGWLRIRCFIQALNLWRSTMRDRLSRPLV